MFVQSVFEILSEHCKMNPFVLFLTQLSPHCCIYARCNSDVGRGREQQTEHGMMMKNLKLDDEKSIEMEQKLMFLILI